MDKQKIRKKTLLELMKSTRVPINMNTSPKVMESRKGKGSYRRKLKHKKQMDADRG
jgi:hypothetical protein